MKLLYCPRCLDIVRLMRHERTCECGAVSGRYIDNSNAEYAGGAMPIGLANGDVEEAGRRFFHRGKVTSIRCWVEGPTTAPTWRKRQEDNDG